MRSGRSIRLSVFAPLVVLCGSVVFGMALGASDAAGRDALAAGAGRRLPDVVVRVATVALRAGDMLTGTAQIVNLGARQAPAATAWVAWRSWRSRAADGLTQIGRFRVPALSPGQLDRAHFRLAAPGSAGGSYEVSVCANALGRAGARGATRGCRMAGAVEIAVSDTGHHGAGGAIPAAPPASAPDVSMPGEATPGNPTPGSPTPGGSTSPEELGTPAPNPLETVISAGPANPTDQTSATFSLRGGEASDTFQCSLDGALWVSCVSPQQYTALADGNHTFRVRAVDASGAVDPTPAEWGWTVDTIPPLVSLSDPESGSVADTHTPTFSGTAGTAYGDSPAVAVKVYAGSSVAGTPKWTLQTTAADGAWLIVASWLPNGTYTAVAEQGDAAGNIGLSAAHTFAVAAPPPPHTPILFVAGWHEPPWLWSTMVGRFEAAGWNGGAELYTLSYDSSQSAVASATEVAVEVKKILEFTGASKVDLVTHSFGALPTRYYIKNLGGEKTVEDWVSLGGPNHGTDAAYTCSEPSCTDMEPGSTFLTELNAGSETPGPVRYATWWSPCDEVIVPNESVILQGAANTETECITHEALMTNEKVYDQVREFLK
jgi:triacylglycerol esterase/lipase EstA (alpha/beta hydrolase family)